MSYSISDFLARVDKKILARGKQYYKDEAVTNLKQNDNKFTAAVIGSEYKPYQVNILLNDASEVEDWNCNCPYDDGDVCKHVVATLYAINTVKAGTPPQKEDKPQPSEKVAEPYKSDSLDSLLSSASKEKLIEILKYLSTDNVNLRAYLMSELGGSFDEEIKIAKELLSASIRSNTHAGFIDWKGCDSICVDMESILDKADKRLEKAQAQAAFELSRMIVLRGMKLSSTADSSSGMLGEAISRAFEIMGEAVTKLKNTDITVKSKCLATLIKDSQDKVFDGWSDEPYILIEYASRLADAKSRVKLCDTLDSRWERDKSRSAAEYHRNYYKIAYYHITNNIDGEAAGDKYLNLNIDIPKLRRISIEKSIANADYGTAERLCLEILKGEKHNIYGNPPEWYYLLYECYEKSGNRQKQLDTARKILMCGDTKYYSLLKELYTADGIWEREYCGLLNEISNELPYHQYMELLSRENETQLLMEQLTLHVEMVFDYGGKLAKLYKYEIATLATAYLVEKMESANNRGQYAGCCALLKKLADWGLGDTSRTLIEEFRMVYPRRPAMQEELSKIEVKFDMLDAKKEKIKE